jgi:hypothetical protein
LIDCVTNGQFSQDRNDLRFNVLSEASGVG